MAPFRALLIGQFFAIGLSTNGAIWPAMASDRVGLVLLHGKRSAPEQHGALADAAAAAGYLVDQPEMCWSHRRIYDRSYLDCLRDIDDGVARLKANGATAIVIAGHGLGANGALAYGAANRDLKGIIALAPSHRPKRLAARPQVAQSLATARRLVAADRGNATAAFADFNGPVAIMVTATPKAYLSFFGPDSPAAMPANAERLTAPLLLVVAADDPLQRQEEIFSKAPPQPHSRYVTVRAGLATSAAARHIVIEWLNELSGRQNPGSRQAP
jgi:pimeloyl-ACP methyl ester carboxylesterase